jgi:hypothetical protein
VEVINKGSNGDKNNEKKNKKDLNSNPFGVGSRNVANKENYAA